MKKLSILALFSLLLILSISFASAEDVNADDMAIDESSGQKEVSVEETHEDLKAGNTIYISPSGTGTGSSESDPTNWNDALSKASSGGVIEFSNGTYYDVKNIYVNNVELKGSGNTVINASGDGGFFATYGNVILNKLSFVNAYTGDKQGNLTVRVQDMMAREPLSTMDISP